MNIVLYVLDALRADHVSCYGYDRETTPTVDRLAADGILFEQCFTPATWTRPVAASISSGSYPPTNGTETRHDVFDPHVPALAEQLSAAGYETVGITSMGNVSSAVGFDRGFDDFYDVYKDPAVIERRRTSTATDEELKQEDASKVALPRAADLNATFTDWLDGRDRGQPFFAFFWSIEPHMPYDPPEGFRDYVDPGYRGPVDGERECLTRIDSEADLAQLKALYDGEIAYNDACLDSLIAELDSEGVYEDTLVVVLGDHGDAFQEHGRLTHGHAPYDELMHVPCLVRPPDTADGVAKRRVDELCSLVDLYPTILEYATDLEIPEGVQGTSLSGVFDGDSVNGNEYIFSKTASYDMQNTFYGVRSHDSKYIEVETPETSGRNLLELLKYVVQKGILTDIFRNPKYYLDRYRYSETEFLYDLASDPGERRNLVDEREERRAEFAQILWEWHSECVELGKKASSGDAEGEIDEATREQLRQLGYTD
jgi:arylsulfatase A-like enzyme